MLQQQRSVTGWLGRALRRFASPRIVPALGPPEAELQAKASRTGPLIAFEALHRPVWSPRDYAAFAREGFAQNAIVYRSVRMVAEAAASVPLLLFEGDEELTDHPLLSLLARPNPVCSTPDLLESWYGFLLVSGNAYLEAVAVDGTVRELHALRPDRMKVVPGPDGWPEAFEYGADGRAVRFAGEAVPGVPPILHVKLFNPVNDYYGMSPIEAAAQAIDTHNTASRWNKALLDNSARPSGALVYTARDGNLTPDQVDRLKTELEQGFTGAARAGRPLLLEGGLDWKSMSLTPKDMDFIEAKHVAAREIALAIGVPPMLLAIPGDNTYSNYQEATRSFWRQTVLPLVNRTAKALSAWLAPAFADASRTNPALSLSKGGATLELRPDLDAIEGLSVEREALWSRIDKATFLTPNEKRAAVGYGPAAGSDEIKGGTVGQKFNPHHDERGRFTFGPNPDAPQPASRRRAGRGQATPAQEARLAAAEARGREATRQLRELEPDWRGPQSLTDPEGIEGRIAHQEATAEAAEGRLAEILRDAIPSTNPSWGVNRLTKELQDQGYILDRPTRGAGLLYVNPETGDQVRIMERPSRSFSTDSPQKHFNDFYYRYKPAGQGWGAHITIPNK
jgi:HK97 family phage portal protein